MELSRLGNGEFPQKYFSYIGHGEATPQRSYSRHLLAGFLLREHHIFMQTLSRGRLVKTGCSDAHCCAASPSGLRLMSLLSDCGRFVSLPRLCLGEPLARRSVAKAGTGRGRLPPATAGLEVTPPQADEPWNDRRDISKR